MRGPCRRFDEPWQDHRGIVVTLLVPRCGHVDSAKRFGSFALGTLAQIFDSLSRTDFAYDVLRPLVSVLGFFDL